MKIRHILTLCLCFLCMTALSCNGCACNIGCADCNCQGNSLSTTLSQTTVPPGDVKPLVDQFEESARVQLLSVPFRLSSKFKISSDIPYLQLLGIQVSLESDGVNFNAGTSVLLQNATFLYYDGFLYSTVLGEKKKAEVAPSQYDAMRQAVLEKLGLGTMGKAAEADTLIQNPDGTYTRTYSRPGPMTENNVIGDLDVTVYELEGQMNYSDQKQYLSNTMTFDLSALGVKVGVSGDLTYTYESVTITPPADPDTFTTVPLNELIDL